MRTKVHSGTFVEIVKVGVVACSDHFADKVFDATTPL